MFYWGHEQDKAIQKLKSKFTSVSIIASVDPEKKIILKTDTSDQALGLCLSQLDVEKQLHPLAYWSRKFSGPKFNYNVYDKELLAIVDAFKEWQVYLEGFTHLIVIYSDHKNLSYFTTTKKLNQRQV